MTRLIDLHHLFEQQILESKKPVDWPKVGETIHGYRLNARLGDGAFSRVFLAEDMELGNRRVALKFTDGHTTEAFTLGRISHPNIIPVYSIKYDEDSRFTLICMPYLGTTLCRLLDLRRATPTGVDASLIA